MAEAALCLTQRYRFTADKLANLKVERYLIIDESDRNHYESLPVCLTFNAFCFKAELIIAVLLM